MTYATCIAWHHVWYIYWNQSRSSILIYKLSDLNIQVYYYAWIPWEASVHHLGFEAAIHLNSSSCRASLHSHSHYIEIESCEVQYDCAEYWWKASTRSCSRRWHLAAWQKWPLDCYCTQPPSNLWERKRRESWIQISCRYKSSTLKNAHTDSAWDTDNSSMLRSILKYTHSNHSNYAFVY